MARSRQLLAAIFVAAIAVRLIRIGQPFIDQWSWRQSDVASIARNFYTGGFHFAHPQIDWAGDAAGYVGTEFPVLPFIAASCYKVAGVHEWIGRVQALGFFAVSVPFFYLLVRELFGEGAAVWAAIFYSFAPLSIATSRAFMPDMPSLALAIAGMQLFLRWNETERWASFFASATCIALGVLIKAPTALIGAPMLYLVLMRGVRHRLPQLALFAIISLLPATLWYWHAWRIAQQFYPHHFFGAGGLQIENAAWYWRIAKQTVLSSLTPALALLAIVGAFVRPAGKYRYVFHWWAAAMLVFIVLFGWGNRHQWYQLPLVPIAAVWSGYACEWLARKFGKVVVAGTAVAFVIGVAIASPRFFAPAAASLRELGLTLKEISRPSSLVIAADDGDPTIFYYAERKGWHFLEKDGVFYGNPLDDEQLIADFDKLRARGAKYLVFSFGTKWWLEYYRSFAAHVARVAILKEQTPNFVIYEIHAR